MEKNFKLSDTKLSDIEIEGKIIFIYSDKFDIYFFIEDHESNSLYQITTDKYFYIKHIEKVEIPEEYFSYEKIKFSKPIEKQDTIIFIKTSAKSTAYVGVPIWSFTTDKLSRSDANRNIVFIKLFPN